MLASINREMMELKEKLREYNKLKSLEESKSRELEKKKLQIRELKKILDKERKDVEKLEALSLATMFFTLLGNKYEKIDKEKEEYLLAKLKFEDSKSEIDKLEAEIRQLKSKLSDYRDVEGKYKKIISQKGKLIIDQGGSLGLRLKDSMVAIDETEIDIKEIREAINAGENTLKSLKSVRGKLGSAKSWGVWDILGGGIISDIAKHSAINEANEIAEDVKYNLKLFKKELSDVNEFTDIQVNLSSFASFADFFFDGIFADWFVQSKINNSLDNVNYTIVKIEEIDKDLKHNLINLEAKIKNEREECDRILNL